MTPSPSAAPLPPLPEEVEIAIDVLMASVDMDGCHSEEEDEPPACRAALVAAIRRYAEADPRPAGCVCPVERVVHVLKGCTAHGERKP